MNDKFGNYGPRPARLEFMGVLLAIVGIALLAACSSSSSTASGGSATSSAYTKALAYAKCIRAHGVPGYPDPNSKGQFVQQNGSSLPNVSQAVVNAASTACQSLLPPTMIKGSAGLKATNKQLEFAKCMRSHGVPNFPDPGPGGQFTLPPGLNYQSPQLQNADKACQKIMPMNPGGQGTP